jgi:hypothetical protein
MYCSFIYKMWTFILCYMERRYDEYIIWSCIIKILLATHIVCKKIIFIVRKFQSEEEMWAKNIKVTKKENHEKHKQTIIEILRVCSVRFALFLARCNIKGAYIELLKWRHHKTNLLVIFYSFQCFFQLLCTSFMCLNGLWNLILSLFVPTFN